MSQILILDAAFPPAPAQWIADMNAIGADGGAIYVYGGFTNYTADHVKAAQAAGKHVIPIIVTGNAPPAPPLYAAAEPYGLTSGLLVYDVETNSLPGPSWIQRAVDESNSAGWNAGVYCNQSLRGAYSAGWFWLTQWPYAPGIWQPVPTLVSGARAWQYAHDVKINGSLYDVSIFDEGLFEENMADGFTDADRAILSRVATDMFDGQQSFTYDGKSPVPDDYPNFYHNQLAKIDELEAAITALQQPATPALPADFAAQVATALAQNQTFLDALAMAVVHKAGSALGSA